MCSRGNFSIVERYRNSIIYSRNRIDRRDTDALDIAMENFVSRFVDIGYWSHSEPRSEINFSLWWCIRLGIRTVVQVGHVVVNYTDEKNSLKIYRAMLVGNVSSLILLKVL